MDCLGEKKNTWALYCGGNEIVLSNYASEFRRPELRKYPEEAFPLLPGQAEKDKIADFFLAAFGLAWRRAVAISPYPKKRL
jgi:hypothetical protein